MKAMILAAGFGKRLHPLTATCPKPLIDVGGQPMIAFPLALIRAAGITEVAINLHHLGEQIRATLRKGENYGVHLTYFDEPRLLDTGGGIANARSFLEGDDFVVLNADTMTDLPLGDMISFHRRQAAVATMFLRSDPEVERYGPIEIDDRLRIRRVLGRPATVEGSLQRFMFGGVHVFSARVFEYMAPGIYSITRDTYPQLLEAGEPLAGYVFEGYWQLLDTPAGLAAGRAAVAERRARSQSST
jgi:NDP-sugar pyrophosphorylase family protein